jgi:hypothetical protein
VWAKRSSPIPHFVTLRCLLFKNLTDEFLVCLQYVFCRKNAQDAQEGQVFRSSVFCLLSSSLLSEAQPRYFCGFCASLRLTEGIPAQELLSMNFEF